MLAPQNHIKHPTPNPACTGAKYIHNTNNTSVQNPKQGSDRREQRQATTTAQRVRIRPYGPGSEPHPTGTTSTPSPLENTFHTTQTTQHIPGPQRSRPPGSAPPDPQTPAWASPNPGAPGSMCVCLSLDRLLWHSVTTEDRLHYVPTPGIKGFNTHFGTRIRNLRSSLVKNGTP